MKKIGCILFLSIIIVMLFASCDVSGRSDSNVSGVRSTPIQQQSDNEMMSEKSGYSITEAQYIAENINVKYPQISGMADTEKQRIINDKIKSEIFSVITNESPKEKDVTISANYEVKLRGERLLSVIYQIYWNNKNAPHPRHKFFSTNIFLAKPTIVRLSDVVNINDTFIKKLLTAEYVPWDKALISVSKDVRNYIENQQLIELLNDSDLDGNSCAFSYFTDDALGVSIEVPHYLGGHAEIEIKYSAVKDFLKVDGCLYKDFLH